MDTATTTTDRADELLPSRPAKEAMSEIAGMSVFATFAAFVLLAFPSETALPQLVEVAPVAGAEVLTHIGWGFGVYIPVMLGFYAIVIGGQLVASPTVAARTRRRLGFAAEAMAGALTPALLLILAVCVKDPTKAGSLFVVLPAAGVTFFLAVQLGGFVVFEPALRLAEAIRSRAWAASQLPALRSRSRRPVWLVATVTAVLGGILGLAVTVAIAPPGSELVLTELVLTVVYAMFAAGLTLFNLHGLHTFLTARDRLTKIAAWLFPVSIALAVFAIAGGLIGDGAIAGGVSVLAVLAFCTLSALWPRSIPWAFGQDWSVRGAGAALAARAVARTYGTSVRTVNELSATQVLPPTGGLRERLLAVVSALRGEVLEPVAG
ncbi:hypothetical protein AB0P00_16755 [Microbacterium sp. NPDC077057]|uniref:hypothetical protein n=1 Tax=Microbacterium sp. NPDC077057 TaxID=3154763 RepID=UPI003426F9B0